MWRKWKRINGIAPRGKKPKRSCMVLAWRLASDGILVYGLDFVSLTELLMMQLSSRYLVAFL